MRSLGLSRYALCSCVAAALLAGCGGSQPPIVAPGAMPQSPAIAGHAAYPRTSCLQDSLCPLSKYECAWRCYRA
jgi:hypothetical protein